MKLNDFWVVTKPKQNSKAIDICFRANIVDMQYQFLGGLEAYDIYCIYTEEYEAKAAARRLLAERKE